MDDIVLDCCAGLDVHSKEIVACVLQTLEGKKRPKKHLKKFGTTTKEILALSDWLDSFDVTHVSMESTGVYWQCIWRILQNNFELKLANPQRIKNIPGKKTDMKDAEWIARLTRLGMMPHSFVPPDPIQELRDVTRYRKRLLGDLNREKNRGHALLQRAGIKLATVVSDIYGDSGRGLLNLLLVNAPLTSENILSVVYTSLRHKVSEIKEAMDGFMNDHARFMLELHLTQIEQIEAHIRKVEAMIEQYIEPYHEVVARLDEIPGIDKKSAWVIIAEFGTDMSVFPSCGHMASWAGVSPGNNESAGKSKKRKVPKGNRYLKKVLSQGALALSRGKPNRLKSFFLRIQRNSGKMKAIVATVHLIVRIIYKMLEQACPYAELGEDYQKKTTQELAPK